MKLVLAARQAVICGLVILGLMAAAGVWSVLALMEGVGQVTHWEEILERLEDAMTASRDAKSWSQVYFETDSPHALDESVACFAVHEARLEELREASRDEPELRTSFETLASATAQFNDWLQRQIEVHQHLGSQERERMFAPELGDAPARRVVEASEKFKSLVCDRQQRETEVLQARSWWTIGVILVGSVSAACVALFAVWSMHRELAQRCRTESQLREREVRLKTILDSEPECVKLIAEDGTLLEMNAAGLEMIEVRSASQVVGKRVADLVTPEYRRDFQLLNERVFRGGSGTLEFEMIGLKGGHRWLETHATPLRDEQGRVIALLGITRDISERKQAELELRESQNRLKLFIDHAPVALAMLDRDMRYLSASNRWLTDYGLQDGDILGRSHYDVFPEIPERWKVVHRRCLNGEILRAEEDRFERADGSLQWLRWEVRPWQAADGTIGGVVFFTEDISERKRAEIAFREAEVRFRTIFDRAPVGVVLIDPTTANVIECNEVAARQLGYSQEELVRLRIAEFEAIESPEQTQAHIELLLRTGRDEFETKHRTKSGEIRDVLVTTQIIDLSGRSVLHTIFLDITDRKRAEGIIREQERQLATLISSLPGFAYRCGNDADYSIEFVSEGIADLTGYPADDFRNHRQHFGRLIHPADQAMVWSEIQRALQERRAYEFSYRIVTADGGEKWVWERGQGVFAASRTLLTLEGFVMDITAHKQTELALQASEERFRSFMDHLPAEAFIKDSSGRYLFGNKHWSENYPPPLESVLGKTDFELWPNRLAEMFQASDREVLRSGRMAEVQQIVEQDRGIAKWFQVLKFPIQQELAPPLVGGIALEITRLKQTEESLRQTADRLGAVLAIAQTVEATLDLDTLLNQLLHHVTQVISITNRSAIYIHDSQSDVLVPRACIRDDAETYRQIRLKPGESISGKVFQTGRSVLLRTRQEIDDLRGELRPENERLLAQDHSGHVVRSTIGVPLRTRSGDNLGTMTLASTRGEFTEDDLSLLEGVAAQAAIAIQNAELFDEVRAGRERLQGLSRQLIAAQESERHHLARELHDEIGQVLTAVSLRLQNLKSGRDADFQREMDQGIQLIDQAIEQVRGLSLNLRPAMLDVLGLESAVRWYVNQQREQAGWDVRLVLQLESRLSPEMEITCFRVVQGALTNISRHARASKVEVELHQSDLDLELVVRDNGVGFDLENARQRSEQGERFGLLAMRERVELVGGTFRIDSGSGQGTTIQAHFPLGAMTRFLVLE